MTEHGSQSDILATADDGTEIVWLGVGKHHDDPDDPLIEWIDNAGGCWATRREHPGEEHQLRFHPDESFTLYCVVCAEVGIAIPPEWTTDTDTETVRAWLALFEEET